MTRPVASDLSCSFCRKPQNAVAKLISSPGEQPPAYICDECVAVCSAVIQDERLSADDRPDNGHVFEEQHPVLNHPLASRLLSTVEWWIEQESLGGDAATNLQEVRTIASKCWRTPVLTDNALFTPEHRVLSSRVFMSRLLIANAGMVSDAVNRATMREWRDLGFYYDRNDKAWEWRLVGSRAGLLSFRDALLRYTSDACNNGISEHEHFGPYMYLEVMTWPEPAFDDRAVRGPPPELARLAQLIESKLAEARPGSLIEIREEFAALSSFITERAYT